MNSPDTPCLSWHDGMPLGHDVMDEEHEKLVKLIAGLQRVADAGVAAALEALATHARQHFHSEEEWMLRSGFPAAGCHAAEHSAVLQSVDGVQERVREGDIAAARRLAGALAEWFPGHAEYLDAALAHWICKQQHGGKPVVLRRHVPAANRTPSTDPLINHAASGSA